LNISPTSSLVDEIARVPGGEGIRLCIQCGTCTASCPNSSRMEHSPSHLIALARADMREEVFSSNGMWMCLSCYLCSVRCPRDIDICRLMHVFEGLSAHYRMSSKHTTTPVMYRVFNRFVTGQGRISELWMMVLYYFSSVKGLMKAVTRIPLALSLFSHERISLKNHKMKPEALQQLRAIVAKAEASGGDV
jgi:heterodisulfide reductase subunit C